MPRLVQTKFVVQHVWVRASECLQIQALLLDI